MIYTYVERTIFQPDGIEYFCLIVESLGEVVSSGTIERAEYEQFVKGGGCVETSTYSRGPVGTGKPSIFDDLLAVTLAAKTRATRKELKEITEDVGC